MMLCSQGNVVWNRQRQENKMTMTLIAVVIMFCVCQTPTAVMMLTASVYEPPENTPAYYVNRGLHTIFNFLMVVNAASNFMLYCAMSRKYRRTLMITFMPFLAARHARNATLRSSVSYPRSGTMIRRNTEVTQMTDIGGAVIAGGKREPLMRANKANNKLQTPTTITTTNAAATTSTTTVSTDVL